MEPGYMSDNQQSLFIKTIIDDHMATEPNYSPMIILYREM